VGQTANLRRIGNPPAPAVGNRREVELASSGDARKPGTGPPRGKYHAGEYEHGRDLDRDAASRRR